MKVALVSALILFCAAVGGDLDNESYVNGTIQVYKSADSRSAADLPTPEIKADAPQGNYKVLTSESDLPKDASSLLRWKADHFEAQLGTSPFEAYLVRDQGGSLMMSLLVDDPTKLTSDLNNPDTVKIEFIGTKRYMDIQFSFRNKFRIDFDENRAGNLASYESNVTRFDLIFPAQGIAMFKGGDRESSTLLSFTDVPTIPITNAKEVVRVKVSVQAQGTATFSAFFELGTIALAEPRTDDALIGGLVGGGLALIVVVVVAVIVYKQVKKWKQKKKLEKAAAAALSRKEDTTQLDEKPKTDKPRKTEETTTAPTKPAAQKESSKLSSVSIQEPGAPKDGLGKTSAEKKSVDSQEKSKQKSMSKKVETRPAEQVLKQDAVKETKIEEAKGKEPKEEQDKKTGIAGAVDANKKEAPIEEIKEGSGHSQKNVAEVKEVSAVKDKAEKHGQDMKETRAAKRKPKRELSKDASQETVDQTREETVCDGGQVKPEQKVEEVKEDKPKKIEDPPPPSVRVVTAPIWNFTSRNSAKFARPPAVHLLPNHMPAANPAFFEKGQGTAYDDAVEGVRKQKEEAEQYAADVKAYEDREKGRPAIYRTKYHTGPDPLNAPLWNSEEDDVDTQNGQGGRGGRKKSRRSE